MARSLSGNHSAGVRSDIRLYDIRHFYITYALANCASILELAERVGHVDATMIIKVYAHPPDELKTKQACEIPNIHFLIHAQNETVDQTKKGVSQNDLTP
ncbi:MAG: hypothetical protein HY739_11885 [Desulfobacterales bacterium]|nr:hypothetical protein [Desulfobacterales bacterium]